MSRRGGARRGAGLKAGAPNRLALLAAPESRRGLALAPVRHHVVRGQREAALDDGAAALTEGSCSHSTIGSCRSPAWHAARYGSFIQPDQLAVGRREERPPLVHEHQRPRHQVTSDMSALGSPDDMRKRGLSNLARPPRLCALVPKRAAKSVNSGPRGETLIPN